MLLVVECVLVKEGVRECLPYVDAAVVHTEANPKPQTPTPGLNAGSLPHDPATSRP